MTSAMPMGESFSLPLKITSTMDCPRKWRALCSPIAQRRASTMFDLPHPFGPTILVMSEGKLLRPPLKPKWTSLVQEGSGHG